MKDNKQYKQTSQNEKRTELLETCRKIEKENHQRTNHERVTMQDREELLER